jgi:hypothetical protein
VLLVTVYSVATPAPLPVNDDSLPLEVQLDADVVASLVRHGADGYRLLVRQRVAGDQLDLVEKSGWSASLQMVS